MRTAMRAELASKRSIAAIMRANAVLDGAKVTEPVLDILVPFLAGSELLRDDLGTI